MDNIEFSIDWCFTWIMEASNNALRKLVDSYNRDQLSPNWRLALEMIEASADDQSIKREKGDYCYG